MKSVRSCRTDGQPGGLQRQDLKQRNVAVKTGRLATLAYKYHLIVFLFFFFFPRFLHIFVFSHIRSLVYLCSENSLSRKRFHTSVCCANSGYEMSHLGAPTTSIHFLFIPTASYGDIQHPQIPFIDCGTSIHARSPSSHNMPKGAPQILASTYATIDVQISSSVNLPTQRSYFTVTHTRASPSFRAPPDVHHGTPPTHNFIGI